MKYQLLKSEDATTYSSEEFSADETARKPPNMVWKRLPLLVSSILNVWLAYFLALSKAGSSTEISAFGKLLNPLYIGS